VAGFRRHSTHGTQNSWRPALGWGTTQLRSTHMRSNGKAVIGFIFTAFFVGSGLRILYV
jgi:hypothetical protein